MGTGKKVDLLDRGCASIPMVRNILEAGLTDNLMELVLRFCQMEQNIQVIGLMVRLTDKESRFFLMEQFMMDFGMMGSLCRDDAIILIKKCMKANGLMENLMELG
jgi:hypothetical protein